ncbi:MULTISPECIES: hypothetical protein [unclassified Vibrio]|uniref:hypothetical protein n=1 Tax=unclassified Vibrio TaxID=2614977 RepID=UPI000B8E3EBE|nr:MULTISPECIES: hypothetical protein [unclassified Vibrio]NAX19031.1 hypothetical protein [Vibrio sp. V22_P2S10T140]OXX44106.1 hypothetical protein B9J83_08630 [Vibrio sp. V07_P2A8T137]OXX58243.1 hypothetical protein B9J82_08775 [Vibrio sp. V10_P2A27P122]PSD42410.1 hypothetical protein C7E22_05805 [Vibrio sp. V02_P2A34T13]
MKKDLIILSAAMHLGMARMPAKRNAKADRQRCTIYTPDSPEVKVMTKQFWERAAQKGTASYYCTCDNDHCEEVWFQIGREGETCRLCKVGKLHHHDVEPWD